MKLQSVFLGNDYYSFPSNWKEKDIHDFVMQGDHGGIRVCPICHKIDVTLTHFSNGMCISQEHSKLH